MRKQGKEQGPGMWRLASRLLLAAGSLALQVGTMSNPARAAEETVVPLKRYQQKPEPLLSPALRQSKVVEQSHDPDQNGSGLITGSIGRSSGEGDGLVPGVSHFSLRDGDEPTAAADSAPINVPINVPVPDAPAAVSFPAPDIATMLGVVVQRGGDFYPARLPQAQRDAISAVYAARQHAPLWIEHGRWNDAARSVINTLGDAASHGLNAADYAVPEIAVGETAAEALATADIRLTALAVTYARDARGGRLNRIRIGQLVMPAVVLPTAEEVVQAFAGAGAVAGKSAGEVLAGYQPQAPGYRALRAELQRLRSARVPMAERETPAPGKPIADGPTLKVGMKDSRVPQIRARLGLAPVAHSVYDDDLARAVASFQRERGLPGNGSFNRRTLVALAGGSGSVSDGGVLPQDTARLESDILVNMERWRWLPADLGQRHIWVNIPEQNVRVVDGEETIHTTRGVIGKAKSPTPVFSDRMQYLVVNPYWTVPPSIMRSEFLPGLARDPGYAAKRGYEVIYQGGRTIVRQPPGERNALGNIKFMFPNDLAIYLHDTPNRSVFGAAQRALSHGCVRVEDPFALAEIVLGPEWTGDRLKKMIGGKKERTVRLPQPLPIHLTYFTLKVDQHGRMQSIPDVYDYDKRMKNALGLASSGKKT